MAGDELGRLRNQVNQLSSQRVQQGPVDVYLHDGRTYYEKEFDAQMQMQQLQLKKQALANAEQQRQQRNQQEYDRRLEQVVKQTFDAYYKALNSNIPDLVISGTCGSMYGSVYKRSHPLIQEALQKTVNGRVQEIQSKIPTVNLEDAQLEARGHAIHVCLANAKQGGDKLQYFEPIIREMYTEIKGLLDNQATRDPSFGATVYKDWNSFYSQMKGAYLTPLTPAEKEASEATTTDAKKKFEELVKEALAAGVSKKSIMKGLNPLSKKIDATWGGFDQLVAVRDKEFERLVLEAASGDTNKRSQVINDAALIERIRNQVELETVMHICISNYPRSEDVRKPAEETLKILIEEAKINGGDKSYSEDTPLLSSDDLEQYNKVKALLLQAKEKKIPVANIQDKLAPIYDKIANGSGEGVLKVKGALPKYYNHFNERAKANSIKPPNDMVVRVAKGNLVLDLCKQNIPEASIARSEVIEVLPSIIDRLVSETEKLKEVCAKLYSCDVALFSALNVSTTNQSPEGEKLTTYFVGKLAPYYNDLKTNSEFDDLDKYMQQTMNECIQAVGATNYEDLTKYCSNNNISTDDLNTFLSGNIINQAAHANTPISDFATAKYIETSNYWATNPSTFFTNPYKNYDTLAVILQKYRDFRSSLSKSK